MEPFVTFEFENPNDDDEAVETDKARLLLIHDDEYWVPLSVIEEIDNDALTVDIHTWWAADKGLT